MKKPELIFIAGCNASGKSTFIRTRLNEFSGFEVIISKKRITEESCKIITANQNFPF